MYVIKNAIKNLKRNKIRNIICAIIILAIVITTAISLIINTTTEKIINDYKNRFGSEVSIQLDIEKLISTNSSGNSLDFNPITNEQYDKIAESDTLKGYNLKKEISISFKDLKAVGEDGDTTFDSVVQNVSSSGDNQDSGMAKMPTASLQAATDSSAFTEFADGQRKITDGKMFEKEKECIVSKDFADLNNLKVGSKIIVLINGVDGEKEVELTISGIYTDLTDEYGGIPIQLPFMNKRNQIITSEGTLSSDSFKNAGMNVTASYTLKNPNLLEQFKEDAKKAGVGDSYIISTDENSYNQVVGPVEGISKITMTFMMVVIILGGVILILIYSMSIRERKYEIGVLRAMGMEKSKIALQFLTETLLITCICLIIGTSFGAFASQPIADKLLENQIKIAEEQEENQNTMGGLVMIGDEQQEKKLPISEIKVSLSPKAVLQISLISMILAIVASLASIVYITKYEPNKILSERN